MFTENAGHPKQAPKHTYSSHAKKAMGKGKGKENKANKERKEPGMGKKTPKAAKLTKRTTFAQRATISGATLAVGAVGGLIGVIFFLLYRRAGVEEEVFRSVIDMEEVSVATETTGLLSREKIKMSKLPAARGTSTGAVSGGSGKRSSPAKQTLV